MAQIICFANSYKHEGSRCIAGIDLETKKWVRPIGKGEEGAIGTERLINGQEPQLLDILEIPIGPEADDFGCQPENKVLLEGAWRKSGRISIDDALQYTEETKHLLHNFEKCVIASEFSSNIKRSDWKSIQLIKVKNAHFAKNYYRKLKCNFKYSGYWYSLKTPCPEADKFVDSSIDCILTISMGGPYKKDEDASFCCWKMVAGVIKL